MKNHENLKKIRKESNLTQVEMAEKLGIKQSYYSALERGAKPITMEIASLLVNNCGVSPELFFIDNRTISNGNEMEVSQKAPILLNSPESNEMLMRMHREDKEIETRLRSTRNPLNEKEKKHLNFIDQMDDFKKKTESMLKQLNNVKKRALFELNNENRELSMLLQNTVVLSRLVDVLIDVKDNYISVYNDDSVPDDIFLGYSPIPSYEEYKNELVTELKPLLPYANDMEVLSKHIDEFLRKVRPLYNTNIDSKSPFS